MNKSNEDFSDDYNELNNREGSVNLDEFNINLSKKKSKEP